MAPIVPFLEMTVLGLKTLILHVEGRGHGPRGGGGLVPGHKKLFRGIYAQITRPETPVLGAELS